MKKFDVTALGELLIDFTDNGKSAQGNTLFEANPGGAPCNVLAMLNKCIRPVNLRVIFLPHSTLLSGCLRRRLICPRPVRAAPLGLPPHYLRRRFGYFCPARGAAHF